jgi:glycosyltransferase involved in cell wall biosynthesis
MVKVSFVLPCYNVERYIAECLNSIYAQDLPEEDFEVICVNDCSTDGTRDIIQEFVEKHPNLMLIDHELNMTVGGARNTGMTAARGEYIWFVDADDLLQPDSLCAVYRIAKDRDVDILWFNYRLVYSDLQPYGDRMTFSDSMILDGQQFVLQYFPGSFSEFCVVWRALMRVSFLKENGLIFPQMRKAEDVSFLWKAMLYANRVSAVSNLFYIYRGNPFSTEDGKKVSATITFSDRILRANQIDLLLKDEKVCIASDIRTDMMGAIGWCANSSLELISRMTNLELSRYYLEIKKNGAVVSNVKQYMNRKYKLLFDTTFGCFYWRVKAKLICRLSNMVKSKEVVKGHR